MCLAVGRLRGRDHRRWPLHNRPHLSENVRKNFGLPKLLEPNFRVFETYEGELQFTRNRFINDPTHNTLQSDLYDSSKAEVLGRIETTAIANFDSDWDWSNGHFLAIFWPNELTSHIEICPYGDYSDGYTSKFGDGEVQVYETFVNPLVLRDGSDRDTVSNNIEVVLDVRHRVQKFPGSSIKPDIIIIIIIIYYYYYINAKFRYTNFEPWSDTVSHSTSRILTIC